jgi:hypothetical protein
VALSTVGLILMFVGGAGLVISVTFVILLARRSLHTNPAAKRS